MAIAHPFRAWRPKARFVKDIACVPYDVINSDEARSLVVGHPDSFLHVIRPEIDLPPTLDYNNPQVYDKGADNLRELLRSDKMTQEEQEAHFVYRLIMNGNQQAGFFTCVSVDDYDSEVILKHELTRPDKEDDRTRHILKQQAHSEPVMLTFDDQSGLSRLAEEVMEAEEPLYDFTASDGVQHTLWKVGNTVSVSQAFKQVPKLYVADGHHRCKSASRAAEKLRMNNPNHTGEEEYNFFPAVLFPMDQMEILAYNRIIFEVPDGLLASLQERFELQDGAEPEPGRKGDISIYLGSKWYGLTLPQKDEANSVEKLDVARLQQYLLEPLLGIEDQRRDTNIDFVGGIRGTKELERLVDEGQAEMAISMFPTSIRELKEVSDEGLLMPPKSTWFEPKLRSGLLIHTF